jgi:hypothetical protein
MPGGGHAVADFRDPERHMARSIVNTARYPDDDEALGDLLVAPWHECNVGLSVPEKRRYLSVAWTTA